MTTRQFWDNTKVIMKEKGVTQQVLADLFKVSIRTVQGWFSKAIPIDITIAKLMADRLEVSLDTLCGGDNSLTPDENEVLNMYRSIPEKYREFAKNSLRQVQQLKDMD